MLLQHILQHRFFKNFPNAHVLFQNTLKFGTLASRISSIANKITENPASIPFKTTLTDPKDIANSFRGDAFEAFSEIFFKFNQYNPLVGAYNYAPFTDNDYGVDATALSSINGKLTTIQCKFRGEYDKVLDAEDDHLHNFVNQSLELGVDPNLNDNMIILTSGKEVHIKALKYNWQDKVKYISRSQSYGCFKNQKYKPQDPTHILSIESLTNDNIPFWNNAVSLIQNNQT